MNPEVLVPVVVSGVSLLTLIIGIIVAIVRGDMKKFIEEKMIEAEKSGKSGTEKLAFVIDAFKEKYKILQIILNAKSFVEQIIAITKQINIK